MAKKTAAATTTALNPRFEALIQFLDETLDDCKREMPVTTYKRLYRVLSTLVMETRGYKEMTFGEALDAGLEDIVTHDRKKQIVGAVELTEGVYEFPGGSVNAQNPVWAK